MLINIIKSLFCKHDLEFVRNIHGDEIYFRNNARSHWRCKKCNRSIFKKEYMNTDLHKKKTCEWYEKHVFDRRMWF